MQSTQAIPSDAGSGDPDGPGRSVPAPDADAVPTRGPTGPRTPYPVNDPAITEPRRQPGSDPDVIPGRSDPMDL